MKRTKPFLLIKVSRVFQAIRNREEIEWIEARLEMIDNKTETPLWSRDSMKREDLQFSQTHRTTVLLTIASQRENIEEEERTEVVLTAIKSNNYNQLSLSL